ncbi:MAG TPA: FAD-dependent monooxygenase [Xanthobacteraceae bacterium]|nr:FAD-dependent monooxygenase [Xanthobacteraceae bacterium]
MNRSTSIAVIGAGLGGMTVAGLLQRAGFNVSIFEQAPAFSRIGAGIHLSANVMKVMRRLGVEQALSDVGLHPGAFVSRKWDSGEVLFELPLDAKSEAHYGAAYINVHRGDLHTIVESALAHGTIAFGKKLVDIEPAGERSRLLFADGSRQEVDLVIGADGVNSLVRRFVIGPDQAIYTGHVAHRAVFPAALLNGLPIRPCTKWWGVGNHILVYYMTETREEVYFVSSAPQAEWNETASFVPCDRDEFLAVFDGYHKELRTVIEAAPAVTKWPVFERARSSSWHKGNIVLLGDAAHGMRPYMAAGAAMAIEDAAILSRAIADEDTRSAAESFALYEANRMPRVNEVQDISNTNTWFRNPVDPTWFFAYDACAVPLIRP